MLSKATLWPAVAGMAYLVFKLTEFVLSNAVAPMF